MLPHPVDENIRDQVIEKCNSRELLAKFLEKAHLKLLDVLSFARVHEAVRERLEAMDRPMEPNLADNHEINVVRTTIDKSKLFVMPAEKPAITNEIHNALQKEKKCIQRGKIGHYKAQCPSNYSRPRSYDDAHRPNLNYLEEEEKEVAKRHTVKQNGDIFTVNSPLSSVYRISVDIGDVHVPNVVIDSGAVTNIITKNTWGQLTRSNVRAYTCCSAINLFAYESEKSLPTLGTCSCCM